MHEVMEAAEEHGGEAPRTQRVVDQPAHGVEAEEGKVGVDLLDRGAQRRHHGERLAPGAQGEGHEGARPLVLRAGLNLEASSGWLSEAR